MIGPFIIPALLRRVIGLVPWQAWLVAGVLVVALLWHRNEVRQAVAASYAALVRQSEVKDKAADGAEMDVLRCPPGKWNRETHRCEP